MHVSNWRTSVLCFTIGMVSCGQARPVAQSTDGAGSSKAISNLLAPYPPGRWRLANSVELGNVVLWASHILIRYREASQTGPCFSLANWYSESAKVERSREEALTLIRQLRDQLVQQPERFAGLAAVHSEDVATRSLGGSLGAIQAYQLTPWAQVLDALDALAQTPPGTISDVVETAYGFHLFERRRPPAEDTVSGAHIIVGHNEAQWLAHNSRGKVPFRTRADALALANDLYAQAKANPDDFSSLIDRYSEHLDAVRSGDIGTWSNTEVTPYSREIEILSKLTVGDVAPPIDSPLGFEILRRTPNRAREWYAAELLQLPFDPQAGQESEAALSVLAQMREFSEQVRNNPVRFSKLQQQYCCTGSIDLWQDGRGAPLLTDALSRLELDEIGREPVLLGSSYVLPKRLKPVIPQPPTVVYDLPSPDRPSIEPFIASHGGDAIANVLAAAAEEAQATLQLPAETVARISRLQGDLRRFNQLGPAEEKLSAYKSTLTELSTALGPSDYPHYQSVLNTQWERLMLHSN